MADMAESSARGYLMSNSQLNELWHYDMEMASLMMGLPLRKCSSVPKPLPNFPPLDSKTFEKLKTDVRTMWIYASFVFQCQKGPYGWGLFFKEDCRDKTRLLFSETKAMTIGWLARVPSQHLCPTGHRYLRSLLGADDAPVYLGGAISLANFDQIDRVTCKQFCSSKEPLLNKMGLYKTPRRKIVEGQEVLWSYNLPASIRHKSPAELWPQIDWVLDECCTDSLSVVPVLNSDGSKKRKVGGQRPLLTAGIVTQHKPCTYCGLNMAADAGKKVNMKRHWATNHAVELCHEMGVVVDDETSPVSSQKFITHLDTVDHVISALNSHNYKIVPACSFFEINDTCPLPPNATPQEREAVYRQFLDVAKSAFLKYQVVFLKGITIPQSYEDLLKADKKTNFGHVNWEGCQPSCQPSGNNFSLSQYELSSEETAELTLDIQTKFTNAVLGWM